jgi:putative membrane protein
MKSPVSGNCSGREGILAIPAEKLAPDTLPEFHPAHLSLKEKKAMSREKHLFRGILAGVAGGLAASWVMNEFIAGPGKKLQHSLQTPAENWKEQREAESGQEDSTMKVADAIVATATGGQHLTYAEKEKAGPAVHYAFGAIMGGLYGGLAEYVPGVRSAFGTTFGTALFTGADAIAVPALKLGPPVTEESAGATANYYGAHLVYGATTELVRRIVRAVL